MKIVSKAKDQHAIQARLEACRTNEDGASDPTDPKNPTNGE
jgi:hypothetical protein